MTFSCFYISYGRKCEWNLCWVVGHTVLECCEWNLCMMYHKSSSCWKKMRDCYLSTIFWLLNFFIFVSPLLVCAAAYVSAIWRIYSSKELQRSLWEFWFWGSANNNWIDHFPGMLRTYFQQAFVLFFHKIFATNYQMRANKTNLFGMDLIVGTFDLN